MEIQDGPRLLLTTVRNGLEATNDKGLRLLSSAQRWRIIVANALHLRNEWRTASWNKYTRQLRGRDNLLRPLHRLWQTKKNKPTTYREAPLFESSRAMRPLEMRSVDARDLFAGHSPESSSRRNVEKLLQSGSSVNTEALNSDLHSVDVCFRMMMRPRTSHEPAKNLCKPLSPEQRIWHKLNGEKLPFPSLRFFFKSTLYFIISLRHSINSKSFWSL